MQKYDEHINQAKHNENLASELLQTLTYKDWIITICFYSALHYVDAELSKRLNVDPEISHPQDRSIHSYREDLVRTFFKKVFEDYRFLSVLSRSTRYHCYTPTDTEAKDSFNLHLVNIKNFFNPR